MAAPSSIRIFVFFICGAIVGATGPAAASNEQLAQRPKTFSNLEVEQRLKELGLDPGPIDGTVDDQTGTALRAFQKKAGVPETGKIDDATMTQLVASTEAKLLHSLPAALLPSNTAPENFGTKIILRHAPKRKGAMVMVIPHRGGYQHKLQFLGLTPDGRAHVESTLWTHGAIHEIEGPLTLAGYEITPDGNVPMVFRVDRKKGYVFVSGEGRVKPPGGAEMIFGAYQQGLAIGHRPTEPRPKTK